jgi:DNA mismatch repair protein MutS
MFKEYCHYLHKYKEKYGEKTVVLMQVGSFYEIYAILNDEEELGETNIHHLCNNIMNIAVANKTNNMLMGGFQVPYADKFLKLLINDGYHIVLVDQLSEGSGAERDVKEVLSPGTFMEYSDNVTSNIMSVYIEKISATFVAVGISVIDVSTGNNYVYQIDENLDPDYWKDELSRLINYYSPKEFLFQTKGFNLTHDDTVNYWDVNTPNVLINHYNENIFESIVYQNEFLQKVFHFESQISPIEELNIIHCYQLRNSYIYMLHYIYEHNQDIIKNINYPEKINDIKHLSIAANGVSQLNVVQNYSFY